jgi:hypothetical protein
MRTVLATAVKVGMIVCDNQGAEVARVKATSERGDSVVIHATPLLPGAPDLFTLFRRSRVHVVDVQRSIF